MNDNARGPLTSTEPRASEAIASMSSKLALEQPEGHAPLMSVVSNSSDESESLFEQVPWLYAFCRENLFRDDTERISHALWPAGPPVSGTKLIELGCGPGFYSCRLARRFRQISVVGVDRSNSQLAWARGRALTLGLRNCRFERVNALDIPYDESHFDALVASRLFTVLSERELALAEMHRVLRVGGRCLIAEPRHAFSWRAQRIPGTAIASHAKRRLSSSKISAGFARRSRGKSVTAGRMGVISTHFVKRDDFRATDHFA